MHFLRRFIPGLEKEQAEAVEAAALEKVNPKMNRRQLLQMMAAAAGNPSAMIPEPKIFMPVEGLVTPEHVFSPLDLFKQKLVTATTDARTRVLSITGMLDSQVPAHELEKIIEGQRRRNARLDFLREEMGGFSREQLERYTPSTELLIRVSDSGGSFEVNMRQKLLSIPDAFIFPEEVSFERDLSLGVAKNMLHPLIKGPVPANVKVSAGHLKQVASQLEASSRTAYSQSGRSADIREKLSKDRPSEKTIESNSEAVDDVQPQGSVAPRAIASDQDLIEKLED
jgi:hypothetical protein